MHGTCSSGGAKLFKSGASGLEIGIAFILATVIDVKVVKTKASFLTFKLMDT